MILVMDKGSQSDILLTTLKGLGDGDDEGVDLARLIGQDRGQRSGKNNDVDSIRICTLS